MKIKFNYQKQLSIKLNDNISPPHITAVVTASHVRTINQVKPTASPKQQGSPHMLRSLDQSTR